MARYTTMPNPFEIEKVGLNAVITFTENVRQVDNEYEADTYKLVVPFAQNLRNRIENNFETWLNLAKSQDYENAAAKIRAERDKLLAASDWTQCVDVEMPDDQRSAWRTYRQALRDVPQQEGFPYEVVWPTMEINDQAV